LENNNSDEATAQGSLKPTTNTPPPTTNPSINKYAFEGSVIRLTEDDFRRWEDAYPNIDLRAELTSLDDWYGTNLNDIERKKWFARCSNALAKKNRGAKAQMGSLPAYDPDILY
jgi:hypothetical protein